MEDEDEEEDSDAVAGLAVAMDGTDVDCLRIIEEMWRLSNWRGARWLLYPAHNYASHCRKYRSLETACPI